MAIVGIYTNRKNPDFTLDDFLIWMPQFENFMNTDQGKRYFNKIYPIANNKIFKSIFGTDWELAMSYAIAFYITLIGSQVQAPAGSTLQEVAGYGNYKSVISSASIGEFSKQFDIDKTMLSNKESLFWNQNPYGAALMALLETKAVASMAVVTSNPIPDNYPQPKNPWAPFTSKDGD